MLPDYPATAARCVMTVAAVWKEQLDPMLPEIRPFDAGAVEVFGSIAELRAELPRLPGTIS